MVWESVLEGTVTDPPPVRLMTCPEILKVWVSVLAMALRSTVAEEVVP